MKKLYSVLIISMLAVSSVMAGCANSSSTPTPSQTAGSQPTDSGNKPVEIDFWYALSGRNGEVVEQMVKTFNESQKEIVVKPSFQGSYYENHAKVLAAVSAGNQPDVTMVEVGSIGAFADAKVLEDLGPYTQGTEKKYIPGLMGNSYWNEKLYAIPFNRSTPLLYVNRDLLKAANLDPAGRKRGMS